MSYDEEKAAHRAVMAAKHGDVWTTDELQRDFEVMGFSACIAVVRRRADDVVGTLDFTHSPRIYFGFVADTA